jgi:serine/threonine-protein kinase
VTVSLDELLVLALASPSTPPVFDMAQAAACAAQLTDADRAALAKLPTPQELACQILSAHSADDLASAAAASTLRMSSPHEDTQSGGDPVMAEPIPEFESLLKRHDACLQSGSFRWDFQFDLKDEIGQGGQGAVYLVENEFRGKKALKIMSPLPYGSPQAYDQDMRRTRNVASIVCQNWHENLVRVELFEPVGEIHCMLMELITGFDLLKLLHPDLMARLKNYVQRLEPARWAYMTDAVFASHSGRVRLQPGMAVHIINKCLLALEELHKNGIVHGDIKPSNIMLSHRGCVKVIDIGSAFQSAEPPQRLAYSARYAAPEVLRGGPCTAQSDFASLGYVLIELLSGRADLGGPLVTAESGENVAQDVLAEHLEAKRDLPHRLHTLLTPDAQKSDPLMRLCTKLVQDDPAARFDNADEAIDCCKEFKNQLVFGKMDMVWPKDIQYWVACALAAMHKSN